MEFYVTPNGNQPAKGFLLSLDKRMRAKMVDMISILQDNGYELREPYSKHLSEGIFELRAKVVPILQGFYFLCGSAYSINERIYQKTQRVPPNEIERAKKYRADYLRKKESSI